MKNYPINLLKNFSNKNKKPSNLNSMEADQHEEPALKLD